jgi:hypothetical protein
MDLHHRIEAFIKSLASYPPREHPSAQVAAIFDALLAQVKTEHPDDPIVAEIEPSGSNMKVGSVMDAGSLIAAAQQLMAAVPGPALLV